MRNARLLWPVALLAGVALGATGMWWLLKPGNVPNPVSVVAPGALYRSGQLEPGHLRREIQSRGIKTVINLGSSKDWDQAVCQAAGVRYMPVAVGDVWQLTGLPNPEHGNQVFPAPDLTAVWAAIDAAGDEPVLFHCWGGTHRTGVIAAMYRIQRQGWRPEDAIGEMKLYGFNIADPKFANVLDYLRKLEPAKVAAAATAP